MGHPVENDLALLAGGEAGRAQRFLLERHVRRCDECQAKVTEYQSLRSELLDIELPDVNWNLLAADMRANIHLGLEAGACVRTTQAPRRWMRDAMPAWNPRWTMAVALMVLLIGSGVVMRNPRPLLHQPGWAFSGFRPAAITATIEANIPVVESNAAGVEFRTGASSLTLSSHGNPGHETVSARGDIGTRYIDSETGSVTITNVSLQ